MGKVIPVILAGGAGSRLWPLSRELFPKQFHALDDDHLSLLQMTMQRAARVTNEPAVVLCNEAHRFLVAEQLRSIDCPWRCIMLEPAMRSTGPAIALAAHLALAQDEEAVLLVLASDHRVGDPDKFDAACKEAVTAADAGALVTFGVRPTHAETGYGYIQGRGGDGLQDIVSFREKPDAASAADYLAQGDYLWNSGMFVLKARTYLAELQRFQPVIASAVRKAFEGASRDLDFCRPTRAYENAPALSIDYAVMEHTDKGKVLPVSFAWSDIGSWHALHALETLDAQGNAVHGHVIHRDVHNSYLRAEHRLIGALGVSDVVIVETSDAVLVVDRERTHEIRDLVAELKQADSEQYRSHREVFRPWGSYELVEHGRRYQVKRIKVKPGAQLSLQRHQHRSEHWVVVRGQAEVQLGSEVFVLLENQSVYIPAGQTHRLANATDHILEVIEVQVGEDLREDDIERLDDAYGRSRTGTV